MLVANEVDLRAQNYCIFILAPLCKNNVGVFRNLNFVPQVAICPVPHRRIVWTASFGLQIYTTVLVNKYSQNPHMLRFHEIHPKPGVPLGTSFPFKLFGLSLLKIED